MRIIALRSDEWQWEWTTDERQLIGTKHALMAMPDVSNEDYLKLITATQEEVNKIISSYVNFG